MRQRQCQNLRHQFRLLILNAAFDGKQHSLVDPVYQN